MPFASFFKRKDESADPVQAIYTALVQKARDPKFYTDLEVPDTVDGRFDMIVIHTMLVLRRIREVQAEVHTTGQRLFDLIFLDMDRSLREMGVGDMSIGRHVKKMAKALYGRAAAYEMGMDGGPELFPTVIRENLYRHGEPSEAAISGIASYLMRASDDLARQSVADIVAGKIDFSTPV